MEILHTYGGEVTGPNVFLAVLYGVLAVIFLCALIYCVVRLESMGVALSAVLTVAFVAISIYYGSTTTVPVRHEVTLQPEHVIDATKYGSSDYLVE